MITRCLLPVLTVLFIALPTTSFAKEIKVFNGDVSATCTITTVNNVFKDWQAMTLTFIDTETKGTFRYHCDLQGLGCYKCSLVKNTQKVYVGIQSFGLKLASGTKNAENIVCRKVYSYAQVEKKE